MHTFKHTYITEPQQYTGTHKETDTLVDKYQDGDAMHTDIYRLK